MDNYVPAIKNIFNSKIFIMKKALFFLCVLFLSCKKNNTDNVLLEVPYPHQWIFTADASADKYVHLEGSNNMKRSEILKSYPLNQLTLERFCEFNVAESKTEFTNKLCYTIQLERERRRWLFAGLSSNGQEVHLRSTLGSSETADPGGDGYKFFIHEMPRVNNVRTVAIESVDNPGYYISTSPPGFNYSATQVTLTQHSNALSATHWQCRSAK
jgi:hypothetical protein